MTARAIIDTVIIACILFAAWKIFIWCKKKSIVATPPLADPAPVASPEGGGQIVPPLPPTPTPIPDYWPWETIRVPPKPTPAAPTVSIGPRIAFCTVCRGRVEHLRKTLPDNLANNADYDNAVFVVLSYGDRDGLDEFMQSSDMKTYISSGRLVYYKFHSSEFHMSHSKNMAARCGMLEGADILVTLDADNYTGKGFAMFISEKMGEVGLYLCPNYPQIKSLPHGALRPARGYAGRLVIRAQDFIKMGGYDQTFDTWRGEDIDLIARLRRSCDYKMGTIPNHFLNALNHSAAVRFKEYPHAQEYERASEWKVISDGTSTVVNFGDIGCGTVERNFDSTGVFSNGDTEHVLAPLPTRIFGIGMQKTATSSLHSAFKILGYDSFHWENNRKAWRIWNEMNVFGRSLLLERSYSLCDNPIPMLFRKLDVAYPNSKFILTLVDEAVWIKSAEAFWNPATNRWYDWDKQPWSHRIHEALYGQRHFDREVFLARYRRHNAEVLTYFKDRPQDLLVMDMSRGAGFAELCGFLGKPIPDMSYPHSNPDYDPKNIEEWRKQDIWVTSTSP